MSIRVRHPFVAGKFYPESATEIKAFFENKTEALKNIINQELSERTIYGAVLPHAGYIYSGIHAIHFFELLKNCAQMFETFIILHPVHRGVAPEYAADSSDKWSTPLGEIDIDRDFIDKSSLPVSSEQQKWEHSAEVLAPFLQHFLTYRFRIVPVGFSRQTPEIAKHISLCIRKAVDITGRKVCLLASSDFTHYEHPDKGRMMDQKVLDRIIDKDTDGIYRVIKDNDISVCGYGPIMCLIDYLTAKHNDVKVSLLSRGHSGETHPSESVVDYVSILFHD